MEKMCKRICMILIAVAICFVTAIAAYGANDVTISLESQDKISGTVNIAVSSDSGKYVTVYKVVNGITSVVNSYMSNGATKSITIMFKDLPCSNSSQASLYAETDAGEKSSVLSVSAHGPHNEGEWETEIAASCNTSGTSVTRCTRCNQKLNSKAIKATGHSWNNPKWDWADDNLSCSVTFVCKRDSNHNEKHTIQNIKISKTAEPTCTKNGIKTYEATYEMNGQIYTSTKSVAIPKINHSAGDWTTVKAATCDEAGLKEQRCLHCQTVLKSEDIKAIGHDYKISYTWINNNTACTAIAICSHNGAHVHQETVKGVDESISEATCLQVGKFTRTASFTNPLFKAQVKHATVTGSHVDANKDGKCDVCKLNLNESSSKPETTKLPNLFDSLLNEDDSQTSIFDDSPIEEIPEEITTAIHFDDSTKPDSDNKKQDKNQTKKTVLFIVLIIMLIISAGAATFLVIVSKREKQEVAHETNKKSDTKQ